MNIPEFNTRFTELRSSFEQVKAVVAPEKLRERIADLSEKAGAPDLWDDQEKAQAVTSQLSHAQSELRKITDVDVALSDIAALAELADEENDENTFQEALAELEKVAATIGELEVQTLLDGEYDERGALLTIRAGAGGVDAADFADMLLRMYLRFSEKQGLPAQVLDISYAEEAGIKSAIIEIDAPYAFGQLSVEAGTHRLVRISPFNAAGKRQTSFAAVEVVPLIEQTDHIDIPENDIRVDVFRSSGPGGQSVNTTDSAVRITHIPTGIVVSCQNEKSQLQNKIAAMRVLQSRLLLIRREEEAAKKKELAGNITASWGDQMRSYVLAPYQMVKDLRTEYEVNNPSAVFDGDLSGFIQAGIRWRKQKD
ncbi:MAG: peptide chain release factor 2 [Microbacteriaceae bacterium]|nr:peptide chain release factor 2 [Microbacteriaceae bacterium]